MVVRCDLLTLHLDAEAEFIRYTASGMVYSLQIVLLLVDGIVQTVGNEPSQRNVSGVCLRGTLLCL